MQSVLSVIGTILLGGAGWLATEFFGKQVIRFYDLRRKVHEELIYTANVGGNIGDDPEWQERLEKAQRDLRRLAAQLHAVASSATPFTKYYLERFKYGPEQAGDSLIGYSNTLTAPDYSRAGHRYGAEKALRLPYALSAELIEMMRKNALHR